MTVNGQTRDATFWVENASVEWPEAEAPFYIVGRLTLQPKSLLPDAECQARFIDVTKFSLPDHRPIGSINRARWVAESASRKARLGAGSVAPAPAPSLAHQLGAITLGTVFKSIAVVASGFAALALAARRLSHRPDQSRRRHAAARLGRSRRLRRPGLGGGSRRADAADLLLHAARRRAEGRPLQLVQESRDALVEDQALRSHDHAALRVRRRRREHEESRRPSGRLLAALRSAAQRGAARHHLRRLPHRPDRTSPATAGPRRCGSTADRRCTRSRTPTSATSCRPSPRRCSARWRIR